MVDLVAKGHIDGKAERFDKERMLLKFGNDFFDSSIHIDRIVV